MKLLYVTIGIVLACAAALLLALGLTNGGAAASAVQAPEGDVVLVGLNNQGYTFTPGTVEAGKPVTLKNDGTVRGCAVWMVQQELGIDADFSTSDTYTFTPRKAGTFRISCSMNMYHGTLEVV